MINIALTGLNGYGEHFIDPLLKGISEDYRLTAIVSGRPAQSQYYETLQKAGVTFYPDLEACFQQESIQLVIIATPMHVHYKNVMLSLQHDASVYCEKPLACLLSQYQDIIQLARKKRQYVAVGYHWSYSTAIRELKQDLLRHKYGNILSAKACAIWNRNPDYYSGSTWKGRLFDEHGEAIYESVMSNCAAHSLHNLLFLLGNDMEHAITLENIQASCYHAHDIEGFDTILLEGVTKTGQSVFYTATTGADAPMPAMFEIQCEQATIQYNENGANIITASLPPDTKALPVSLLQHTNAKTIVYGNPEEKRFEHFKEVIHSMQTSQPLICDATTALPFGQVVEWVNKNVPIQSFSHMEIHKKDNALSVVGLSQKLRTCYLEK